MENSLLPLRQAPRSANMNIDESSDTLPDALSALRCDFILQYSQCGLDGAALPKAAAAKAYARLHPSNASTTASTASLICSLVRNVLPRPAGSRELEGRCEPL